MVTGVHLGNDVRERTRILHVIQNLNYGGMERLVAGIAREVDRDRFESHVLTLQYVGRFGDELSGTASVHLADPLPRWSMVWPARLARQIARIGPDVVHSHSGVWYKASLAARRAGVRRVIHTEHGRQKPDPWQARFVDGLASRRTDVVVAVSDALATQLATTVVSDRCHIHVVRNGVDTHRFRPRPEINPLRRELGLPADVPIIGSVGRLEPIKGYDVMVEAFARLRRRGTTASPPVLVLGGEGSDRPALETLARTLGVAHAVHFLGWRDDIHDLHAGFTIFTMSSRSEGTSVSLLEAMSAGLCPVVTDVGGNSAVLGDELRHRLVPSERPDVLADAWLDALTDHERRQSDGAAASARIGRSFPFDTMVRQYERLYEDEG